jgi:hypothetical protein
MTHLYMLHYHPPVDGYKDKGYNEGDDVREHSLL